MAASPWWSFSISSPRAISGALRLSEWPLPCAVWASGFEESFCLWLCIGEYASSCPRPDMSRPEPAEVQRDYASD